MEACEIIIYRENNFELNNVVHALPFIVDHSYGYQKNNYSF